MPKKTYLKFECSGNYLILTLPEAKQFIEDVANTMDSDEKYTVSAVELTQKEFDETPEFVGF